MYLIPGETSKMAFFWENGERRLTINYFSKKVHHRCFESS